MPVSSTSKPDIVIESMPLGVVTGETLDALASSHASVVALTIDAVQQMMQSGIIVEGAPIELIGGVLVWKDRSAAGEGPMTVGDSHAQIIKRLIALAQKIPSPSAHLFCQLPIALSPTSYPEPDATIAAGALEESPSIPDAGRVFCVIEVADSSLRRDRTSKLRVYAGAGIPQYIIVNIPEKQIEVHEGPRAAERIYSDRTILKKGDTVRLSIGGSNILDVDASYLLP